MIDFLFSKPSSGRFIASLVLVTLLVPLSMASAGMLSVVGGVFAKSASQSTLPYIPPRHANFLAVNSGPNPESTNTFEEYVIIGDRALMADAGPMGTMLDIEAETTQGHISTYKVREGDTYQGIANLFDVSVNTILWANNLSRGSVLRVGQDLIILPVTGVTHSIKKGDTITSIAKKYHADEEDVRNYNFLAVGAEPELGSIIIIPDGEVIQPKVIPTTSQGAGRAATLRGAGGPEYEGFYMKPIYGARKTQGLHGYNGIDFGASAGTAIMAAASGDVIVSKNSGYNGGYGRYVVIQHNNGTQTLYAHMSQTNVSAGDSVSQGQLIGLVGNSGRSTGAHLHFEIRGARNPF